PDGTRLATGSRDTTIVLWDVTKLRPQAAVVPATADALPRLWADLGLDPRSAHTAIWTLAAAPKVSLPFLADRLSGRPAPRLRPVADLIAELGHERFAIREQASLELVAWGNSARAALG